MCQVPGEVADLLDCLSEGKSSPHIVNLLGPDWLAVDETKKLPLVFAGKAASKDAAQTPTFFPVTDALESDGTLALLGWFG